MNKKEILLFEIPLFTKVQTRTPSKEPIDLPADACFAYILQGDNQVFSTEENIIASKGKIILSLCGLTLGQMLSDLSQGYLHVIIIHFNYSLLQKVFEGNKPELWKEIETPVTKFVVQKSASNLIQGYIENIENLFSNKEALNESLLTLKLREIINLLLQTENGDDIRKIINSLFSERKFSFKELVDAHIDNTQSLENLVRVTNTSLSTFKRKFKEVYGTTPAKYQIKRNTERVAELLRVSDKSISEIGYECGFNSPSHLTRSFKERFGLTQPITD